MFRSLCTGSRPPRSALATLTAAARGAGSKATLFFGCQSGLHVLTGVLGTFGTGTGECQNALWERTPETTSSDVRETSLIFDKFFSQNGGKRLMKSVYISTYPKARAGLLQLPICGLHMNSNRRWSCSTEDRDI
ncbi:hypothetical protein LX32DRAFT_288553 [Colletotrichum zoysiae]|uniref:Uncharacterized protein n=1 Tax=Colletotrichum zoysiae TaxID=1216348 RepID=A0AAD9HLA2_9PEZI|nr:hypothetical protein LX32DRAFT_288553 [Colletotrichum zoysiae]